MFESGKINEYRLVVYTDKDIHQSTQPPVTGSVMRINSDWPKRVEFLCPCGCDTKMSIFVNIDPTSTVPKWKLAIEGDKPTLQPAINRLIGCQSHYAINNGKVQWL